MPDGAPVPVRDLPRVEPADGAWHRSTAAAAGGEASLDPPGAAADDAADPSIGAMLRLLGSPEGKRVLDLGCGAGRAAVTFARQGAKVIAVDPGQAQLEHLRQAAEDAGVRIELEHAELAELAFVRADAIDAVYSAYALAEVADLDRVFRQVHRVLKPECPIIFTLPHPAFTMFDPTAAEPLTLRRRYHDPAPVEWARGADRVVDHPRTISAVFTSLTRANLRVDTLLEPDMEAEVHGSHWADLMGVVPPTVVFRARKHGT